jgi:hypothetical protein
VDSSAELATVALCIYPVASRPAQATPLFRYVVAATAVDPGASVQFEAQPAIVNGEVWHREQGELMIRNSASPRHIRNDVTRHYQAVQLWEGRGTD